MTLNDLEHWNRGFYGFYICSQGAFIHALLSRVPFALAGLSCWPQMSTVHHRPKINCQRKYTNAHHRRHENNVTDVWPDNMAKPTGGGDMNINISKKRELQKLSIKNAINHYKFLAINKILIIKMSINDKVTSLKCIIKYIKWKAFDKRWSLSLENCDWTKQTLKPYPW